MELELLETTAACGDERMLDEETIAVGSAANVVVSKLSLEEDPALEAITDG